MGEAFTVDIETIKKNDYCLHPAHYKGRCPYHHKDKLRVEKLKDKIAALDQQKAEVQAEIDQLEKELQEAEAE